MLFYDGSSWRRQPGVDYGVNEIYAFDLEHVWAAVDTGVDFYDGTGWSEDFSGEGSHDVIAFAPDDVWTANLDLFHYNGNYWQNVDDSRAYALAGVDSDHLWIGKKDSIAFYDGSQVVTQFELDGYVTVIYSLDENNVWASAGGDIYYFDGQSWGLQHSFGSGHVVGGIVALAPDDVWAAGWHGTIYHYDGASWSIDDYNAGVWMLWDMDVSAEGHLWAVGHDYEADKSYIFTTAHISEPSAILLSCLALALLALTNGRKS